MPDYLPSVDQYLYQLYKIVQVQCNMFYEKMYQRKKKNRQDHPIVCDINKFVNNL